MCVAHVALIDLGWIYDETQKGLQELTGPHYGQQTDQHTSWHCILLYYQHGADLVYDTAERGSEGSKLYQSEVL